MIAVLQRVKRAAVVVDGETVGKCEQGLCVLLGVAREDTEEDAKVLVQKLVELRIFCDENDNHFDQYEYAETCVNDGDITTAWQKNGGSKWRSAPRGSG